MPFFAMNLSVGLSVQLQGFGLQVASGEAGLWWLLGLCMLAAGVPLTRLHLCCRCHLLPLLPCATVSLGPGRPSIAVGCALRAAGLLGEMPFGSISIVGASRCACRPAAARRCNDTLSCLVGV